MSQKHSLEEASVFFTELAKREKPTVQAYNYIIDSLNAALSQMDYSSLLSLIPYMESGEGYYAFRYIGEARRIFRILNIISLENKFNKPLFCSNCFSSEELMEKYVLTLFALRRISFQLSEDSINEAKYFLQNQHLTPFAIYVLTKDELIIPDNQLYKTIISLYDGIWSNIDMQQFNLLINTPTKK